jgi:dipeptidyl aminopeptidase/acylaminoacyl peptidase
MRFVAFLCTLPLLAQTGFIASDLLKMRSVGSVSLSPDGAYVAYTVMRNDGAGRPTPDLLVRRVSDGKTTAIGAGGGAEWAPDSKWLTYGGSIEKRAGLILVHPDGSGARFLTEMKGTNSPLPTTGKTVAWSPDGKQIAFISAVPGPETEAVKGDPVVITRYLYKPDAGEGNTRLNDNGRLHIFLLNLASGKIRQLTDGNHYEHSIDWSPDGQDLAFVSNREPNEDQFFNYDLFTLHLADNSIHRLTATENAEYRPRWSPDSKTLVYEATKRGLTDLETTMEDTHVWLIDRDGKNRRELVKIDNRQGEPMWTPDGQAVMFTVQERGNTYLYRQPVAAGTRETLVAGQGSVSSWSVGPNRMVACALSTPAGTPELFIDGKQVTDLNAAIMKDKPVATVERFTFISNDNKFEVEAFLTIPPGLREGQKAPMITVIHGGPHGQQGPAFNFRSQVYASHGWATLMVNFRGSTGYGQAFTDAVFADQNGNEAQDVLYGVGAAMRRYAWIDRDRLGVEGVSYGGQLSAWLITQTNMFKAAIPTAAIINLISYNYMTYYNQYEQMEWGAFPHQGNLMDVLWERSALKHVAQAHTPTMLMHGENDNDVPIAEAEQYYIALKDVGTEAVMVRYPREGHGIRESRHQVDSISRSMAWYEAHFPSKNPREN